jgi:hypothetical protein
VGRGDTGGWDEALQITPAPQEGQNVRGAEARPVQHVGTDAGEVQDQAHPAERAADESGRLLDLNFTTALGARDLDGVSETFASPQVGAGVVMIEAL